MTENQRQHLIEGYKALMQYGVQLSQDHLNYDRIFMPLTFVPAYFVLTSLDVREAGWPAEVLIWCAGPVLLLFWHHRNLRSQDRIYKLWDTVACIEKKLCFVAYSTVHDYMNESTTRPDFKLKAMFAKGVGVMYVLVLCYMFWRWSTC